MAVSRPCVCEQAGTAVLCCAGQGRAAEPRASLQHTLPALQPAWSWGALRAAVPLLGSLPFSRLCASSALRLGLLGWQLVGDGRAAAAAPGGEGWRCPGVPAAPFPPLLLLLTTSSDLGG